MNTSASATNRGAFLNRLVTEAAKREVCRVCSVCKVFLGGDPEGEVSHGYCADCGARAVAEVEAYKQQQQQQEVVLVPSSSFNGNHQVRLAERKCTCMGNQYGKKFCRHLRIARWSKRLSITVAEVLRRAAAGCASLDCSFCLDHSSTYPCPRSAAGLAMAQQMIVSDEIARHAGILPPAPAMVGDEGEDGCECGYCPFGMEVK